MIAIIGNKPPFREQSWDIPVFDWDLAEIWYATSEDGFQLGGAWCRGWARSARSLRWAFGLHAGCTYDKGQVLSLLSSG